MIAAASLYGDYNDYSRLALRTHKRLRATAIVHPTIDPYALERMKEDGFVGIRFQWRYLEETPDLTTPEYRVLRRRVADLDWHVHLHDNSDRLPPAAESGIGTLAMNSPRSFVWTTKSAPSSKTTTTSESAG